MQVKGPNSALWAEKLDLNTARDQAANVSLREAGWRVLRIWECETKRDVRGAAMKVLSAAHADIDMTVF